MRFLLLLRSNLFGVGLALLWASTLVAGPPQRAISVDPGFADPDSPVVSAPVRTPAVEKDSEQERFATSSVPIRFAVYRNLVEREPALEDWSESLAFSDDEDTFYFDELIDEMESDGDFQFVGYRPRIPNVRGFSGQRIGQGNNLFSGQRFGRYNNGFTGQRIGQGNNLFSGQRVSVNRYRGGRYVPRYNNFGWGSSMLFGNLLRGRYAPNYFQNGFYVSSASPGFYGYGCR